MDLALALGQTEESLAESMTEREFTRWRRYMQQKGLPFRRLELGIAQLTQVMAKTMGGAAQAKTEDFLFDRQEDESAVAPMTDREALEAAKLAFGFRPRNKRKKGNR